MVFRVGHVGASVQYHIHIYSYTQTSFTPKPRHLSGRTDYGPSGPTPTSATIVHHHLPLQLGRSAVVRSLRKELYKYRCDHIQNTYLDEG
jgi:hypothetical protein